MQKEAEKFVDSSLMEGMFSIRAILRASEDGMNDRKIERVLFDKEKTKSKARELSFLRAKAKEHGFSVDFVDGAKIDEMTIGNSHGGIVAVCTERTVPSVYDMKIKDNGFYVMLEGIEDPYNFGYSLRSLYAMGCSGVILTERNWMSAAGVVARSSAGASEMFTVYKSNPVDCVRYFKERGYKVVCADENTDNILGECQLKLPILLIVGGEKRGISRSVIDSADILVKIGYDREFRASLSAASATTMFAYDISRQNKK